MKWLWVLLAVGLNKTCVLAQTHARTTELIDHISGTMCKCINDALINIDDEVKELVRLALSDSANGSEQIRLYLQNVTEQRATVVTLQLQQFGSIDSQMSTCISESTASLQQLEMTTDDLTYAEQAIIRIDFQDNQKTIERLLGNMQWLAGCEFAHQFIRFGIELEKK